MRLFPQNQIPRLLLPVLLTLLQSCATPQIGGPTAPRDDPAAGILVLPSGRSIPIYPAELNFTGEARYQWPDGRTYEGAWLNGRPEGIGSETLPGGEVYTGTWHDGQRHGHGELNLQDGSQYVGDFRNGRREGEGTLRDAQGLYRGQWLEGERHGAGSYHGNDGASYQGGWNADQRSGYGVSKDASGNRYEGDWMANEPHGFGHLIAADGSEYIGHWEAGQRSGYGRARAPSELVYEGTWVRGRRQGFGRESRPDGSSYEGEWLAGKRHGQGREAHLDGTYHRGTWEQNQPLGPGERRDWSGILVSGIWNGDQATTGILTLPTGASYAGPLYRKMNTRVSPRLQTWVVDAAAAGDPYARLMAGRFYLDFSQPARDLSAARSWLRKAAAAGLAEARFRLAMTWVEESPSRAVALLAAAADQGHPAANAVLGDYYQRGAGVPRDPGTAARYYEQGQAAGSLASRNGLAWLLATAEDPTLRDATRALALIRPIALYTGNWQYLNTLAAACAGVGDFELAARVQVQALERAAADPSADSALEGMQHRLALYEAHQPYLEP